MAAECNDSTCVWVCTNPDGCFEGAGWDLTEFGCTGDPSCGCTTPGGSGAFEEELATSCELGGTLDPCPDGDCPPDDWRHTADYDPWVTPTVPPPTTSTTFEPCAGECLFTFDEGTLEYALVRSTCAEGCDCYYPNFCPPAGCRVVTTVCGRDVPADHGTPPNCTGTTTTTTTPPGCTGSCQWKNYPVIGWVLTAASPCDPTCPCSEPGFSTDYCAETTTPCVSTTAPPCVGYCRWRYGDVTTGWILESSGCAGGTGGCACVPPSSPGSFCNQLATTPCAGPDRDPGPPPPPTPGVCAGVCYYCWSGETDTWTFSETNCVGCVCAEPPYDGENDGEVGVTPCQDGTTTTSTTTTTADPGCHASCIWTCEYEDGCNIFDIGSSSYINPWTLTSDTGCAGMTCGCTSPNDVLLGGAFGSTLVYPCGVGGPTLPPTTTTTAPPACDAACSWQCPFSDTCNGSVDFQYTLLTDRCEAVPDCGCTHPQGSGIGTPGVPFDWPCGTSCTGKCQWRCDLPGGCTGVDTDLWTLVTNTCTTSDSCGCEQPADDGDLDAVIEIDCGRAAPTTTTTTTTTTTSTTTSTTTTTTTAAPTCGTCDYGCTGGVWVFGTNHCDGGCICDPPAGVCLDGATTSTNCVPPV